jgi:PKD domain
MTLPRHLTHDRRPGVLPGRRFALVGAVALAACLALPAAGLADDFPVIDATVFAAGASPHEQQVTFGYLSGCQTAAQAVYVEHGADGTVFNDQVGGSNSWDLRTALTCGPAPVLPSLQFGDITVFNTNDAAEVQPGSALTPGDFSGSGGFPPGELPVVTVPNSTQIRYDRPYRGGDDADAADGVGPSDQPISIDVFTGARLNATVTASATQIAPGQTVTFDATVDPASPGLSYQWSFGDGQTATGQDPEHTFTSDGRFPVTVLATDGQGGGGGGGTTVTVGTPPPATTTGPTTGAFTTPTTPTTATTPGTPTRHPRRHHPAGPGTHTTTSPGPTTTATTPPRRQTTSTTTTTTTHTTPATTSSTSTSAGSSPTPAVPLPAPTTPAVTTPPPATSTASAPTTPAPSTPAPTQTSASPPPARHPRQPLVSGRLIASLNPVPAGSSPLTHPIAEGAGAVAVAAVPHSSSSPLALIASLCGVALLLGLGAMRERRGGPDWRSLRPPWSRSR